MDKRAVHGQADWDASQFQSRRVRRWNLALGGCQLSKTPKARLSNFEKSHIISQSNISLLLRKQDKQNE
jgi:hypothetical protein